MVAPDIHHRNRRRPCIGLLRDSLCRRCTTAGRAVPRFLLLATLAKVALGWPGWLADRMKKAENIVVDQS
jgi:hypothetical protein